MQGISIVNFHHWGLIYLKRFCISVTAMNSVYNHSTQVFLQMVILSCRCSSKNMQLCMVYTVYQKKTCHCIFDYKLKNCPIAISLINLLLRL